MFPQIPYGIGVAASIIVGHRLGAGDKLGAITANNVCMAIIGKNYRKIPDIRRTFVANKIVDHSDIVGASPVGAAPTTSSFSTEHVASVDWANQLQDETTNILVLWFGATYIGGLVVTRIKTWINIYILICMECSYS